MITDFRAAPIKRILQHSDPVHSMLKTKHNNLRNYGISKLKNITNMVIKLFSPKSPLWSLNACLSDMSIFSWLNSLQHALCPRSLKLNKGGICQQVSQVCYLSFHELSFEELHLTCEKVIFLLRRELGVSHDLCLEPNAVLPYRNSYAYTHISLCVYTNEWMLLEKHNGFYDKDHFKNFLHICFTYMFCGQYLREMTNMYEFALR